MKKISSTNLQIILKYSKIPECQVQLINEIFKASKAKKPKNRSYSMNWMLLCLLFQIR